MALLFRAALTGTGDWSSVVQTNGTVAVGSLAGWPAPHLTVEGDGVDGGTNTVYVEKDLGANQTALLVRLIVETDVDWIPTAAHSLLTLLSAADAEVASIRWHTILNNNLRFRAYLDDGSSVLVTCGRMLEGNPGIRELLLLWKAATAPGANDGYCGLAGSTEQRTGSRVAMDSDTLSVRKLRVGMMECDNALVGKLHIHSVEVYDARLTDAEEVHYAAGRGVYHQGVPGVIDVAGNAAQAIATVEIRQGAGAWTDITLAALAGTRTDATQGVADLIAAELDAATGTYDGCLVEATAPPCDLLPASQVVRHEQTTPGVSGTAYLAECPGWLAIPTVAYAGGSNTQVLQTFNAWRVKEVVAGTYRVGIPGSAIGYGAHTVRLTLADASQPTGTFTAFARGLGQRSRTRSGGIHLAAGFDDGYIQNASMHRQLFASRAVRGYFSIIVGFAGGYASPPWRVWRLLQRCGHHLSCHLWSNTTLSGYATRAAAIAAMDRGRDAMYLHGLRPSCVFVAPGGETLDFAGASLVSELTARWAEVRGSSAGTVNNMPLVANAVRNSQSVYNNSYAGADDAAKAAACIAALLAAGGGNCLHSIQFHLAGSAVATETTLALMQAILDAASANGMRVLPLDEFVATKP